MGMGDKKIPYTPNYTPVRDDVCGRMFGQGMMRQCPEPHVIKRYGVGGVANVSVWTCKRCRYRIEFEEHGGLACGLEQGIPPGA